LVRCYDANLATVDAATSGFDLQNDKTQRRQQQQQSQVPSPECEHEYGDELCLDLIAHHCDRIRLFVRLLVRSFVDSVWCQHTHIPVFGLPFVRCQDVEINRLARFVAVLISIFLSSFTFSYRISSRHQISVGKNLKNDRSIESSLFDCQNRKTNEKKKKKEMRNQ
jgi:hypothetical protein